MSLFTPLSPSNFLSQDQTGFKLLQEAFQAPIKTFAIPSSSNSDFQYPINEISYQSTDCSDIETSTIHSAKPFKNPTPLKHKWTPKKDLRLLESVKSNGKNWHKIAKEIGTTQIEKVKSRFFCLDTVNRIDFTLRKKNDVKRKPRSKPLSHEDLSL